MSVELISIDRPHFAPANRACSRRVARYRRATYPESRGPYCRSSVFRVLTPIVMVGFRLNLPPEGE